MDKFRVEVMAKSAQPQALIYWALHTDYSEDFVYDEIPAHMPISEAEMGERVVKHLLKGGKDHWGPTEHPQISFNVGYFPHSVMQQARTHRVGISFDVQSGRYTGERFIKAAKGLIPVEDVVYLRPVGTYKDRQGNKYEYTEFLRKEDLKLAEALLYHYLIRVERHGFSPEHARGMVPFDFRQHFIVSGNLRTMLHFMDLRAKADAQLEIQKMCELMWPHLKRWCPEICAYYEEKRLGKARLAP